MLKPILSHAIPKGNITEYINNLAYSNPTKAGELALQLFCTPQKGRDFSPKEESLLSTSEQHRWKVEDFEIQAYHWRGNGKKVVLSHGWNSNAARWRPLISLLRQADVNLMVFDAPAHGKSGSRVAHGVLYAKALEVVVQHFQPEIVVGHSLGGMSAVYYFANHSNESLEKLLLVGTPSKLSTIIDQYCAAMQFDHAVRKAMDEVFIDTFGFTMEYFTTADFAKKLSVNGLIIQGEKDEVALTSEAYEIHQSWKNAQIELIPNGDHSLQVRSVYRKVMEFCQS